MTEKLQVRHIITYVTYEEYYMDANNLPKFYPGQWIIFKMGSESNLGLGKIKGGVFQGGKWQYKVNNPSSAGQEYLSVFESDVLRHLEQSNWTSV